MITEAQLLAEAQQEQARPLWRAIEDVKAATRRFETAVRTYKTTDDADWERLTDARNAIHDAAWRLATIALMLGKGQ